MKNRAITISVLAILLILTTLVSGCNTQKSIEDNNTQMPTRTSGHIQNGPSSDTVTAYGHVYREGTPIKGAKVEAVSANGTYRESATTNDTGVYVLNLKPRVMYNITATYQGLKHTVRPVWLPGDMNTFDINLTTLPTSTIEGTGYSTGAPPIMLGYRKNVIPGIVIEARSVKDGTAISTVTDSNGYYCLRINPNVLYK